MVRLSRIILLLFCGICTVRSLPAQMPFYTDNADVTDRGTLHFEFFNEFDGLQSAQYPDLRQNTFNYKINYGCRTVSNSISMRLTYRSSAPPARRPVAVRAIPTWASNGISGKPPSR